VTQKKVLLHICCAGCAGLCVQRLQGEGFDVTGVFYNPNIHPEDEYSRRKQDLRKISAAYSIDIIEGAYEPRVWHDAVQGYEPEPEGGERCGICFELRLRNTYQYMLDKDCDFFTTTLTVSPHKNSSLINELGKHIGGNRFLERNFKKQDGFRESVLISTKLDIYRQDYCGCVYSMRQAGRDGRDS